MNAYIDSSVVLRGVFGEKDAFEEWSHVERAISSVLLFIECFRNLDRARLSPISEIRFAEYRQALTDALERIDVIRLTDEIVGLAARRHHFHIHTLDAIHLATAVAWRTEHDADLIFVTHDIRLASAAKAFGFPVLGV